MADRFDTFTARARLALMLAQDEAQRRNQIHIGTEHLLLALIEQPDGTLARLLDRLRVDIAAVRAAIEPDATSGDRTVLRAVGLTSNTKRSIEHAVAEARRLDHLAVDTDHLMLGLLHQEDAAAGALKAAGVSLANARAAIRDLQRTRVRSARLEFSSTPSPPPALLAWPYRLGEPHDALEAATRALRILHDTAGWLERDGLDEDAVALRDVQQQLARFVARDTRRLLATRSAAAGADAAGRLVLFGGPAGAGKSTLAAAWCATRPRAVHIELDAVRELIVAGRADPQGGGAIQAAQYALSVTASLQLAFVFQDAGYDVAVDDVIEPEPFAVFWRPALAGRAYQLVIVTPSLDTTLARAAARAKQVRPDIIRGQHAASLAWPVERRIDTTTLSTEQSLALIVQALTIRPAAG